MIFHDKTVPYQLIRTNNLNLPNVRSEDYGTDTVRFIGQRVRAKFPIENKTSGSLTVLKNISNERNMSMATV